MTLWHQDGDGDDLTCAKLLSTERSRKDPAQSFRVSPASKTLPEQGTAAETGLAKPCQAEVMARAWGRTHAPRQEHEGGQGAAPGEGRGH